MKFIHSNKQMNYLKINMLVLIFACTVQICLSRNNETKAEIKDSIKFRSDGNAYICPPSQLLDGVQPEANWIWDSGEINPKNYYLHVRKSFTLSNSAIKARAFISAFAFAELYINGQYIDRVPTNPDPEYQTYEEIDLTPYLKKGVNTIAALVYNAGMGLHHRMNARGGFFFQSTVTDTKGAVMKVNSDKSWRVAQAVAWDTGTMLRQGDFTIGMRERYDARLAYEWWQKSSFNDSQWKPAKEIGVPPMEPWNQIVVIKRERLFYEVVKPVMTWDAKGYSVFDFGKEISAFPRFSVTAKKAQVEMILGTGEGLNADSLPTMTDNVDYTETYITKEGKQSWQPVTWRGFRYMALKKSDSISIDEVSALFRSFPVQRKGSFRCSEDLLNQIWEAGRWTLQIYAHDAWIDPWREQTQYIAGDTRYDLLYSAYSFGPNIKLLFDYNILCGAFSQRHSDKGAIRGRYPTGAHLGPTTSTYIPDYQLEWVLMLHEYYLRYQDTGLIKQVYPNLKKLLQYFEGYLSPERGLVGKVPGWVVLDHPPTYPIDRDGENTGINCLYYGALNSAIWIASTIMNDNLQAEQWQKKAKSVKTSIQKYLWSEKDKAFKDGYQSSHITQQTQVYALNYGLVPEAEKPQVVEFVKSKGRSCEQSFSYWLLNTMFNEGEGQWALNYIRTNWGGQMNKHDFSGSWWEKWNFEPGMSRSHGWCGGPTALLPAKVLGVEPITPGWKQFKIQPCLYDLKWAEGVVPSIAGDISVKLKKLTKGKINGGMQIEAVVPEKTSAKIYVPIQPKEHFAIYVNNRKIWKDGKFIGTNNKISIDSKSDDFIVFEFHSGSYVINSVDDDVFKL